VSLSTPDEALAHARHLAEHIGPRGSATPAEGRAARYARAEMEKLGLRDVRVEPYPGLRSAWLPYAVIFLLALAGHALFWALRPALSAWLYLPFVVACYALGAWWYARILTFHLTLLHRALPKGPSQNVIGVAPARAANAPRRVVLVGHLDTHRTPWIFQGDTRTRLFPLLLNVGFYSLLAAPLLYLLAAALDSLPLAYLGLATGLTRLVGLALSVDDDRTPYSPGANDNAAAVGTCLALARRLLAEPLARTEVWVLASGCEESGLDGIRHCVQRHGAALAHALFLDFEAVGNGDHLVYLTHESPLFPTPMHPASLALARQAAARCPHLEAIGAPAVGGYTEMGVVNQAGLRGLCVLTIPRGLRAVGEWHRPTDVADRLRRDSLARAHEFAWALLQEWDRGAAPAPG